jgi:hypothetical protein
MDFPHNAGLFRMGKYFREVEAESLSQQGKD